MKSIKNIVIIVETVLMVLFFCSSLFLWGIISTLDLSHNFRVNTFLSRVVDYNLLMLKEGREEELQEVYEGVKLDFEKMYPGYEKISYTSYFERVNAHVKMLVEDPQK